MFNIFLVAPFIALGAAFVLLAILPTISIETIPGLAKHTARGTHNRQTTPTTATPAPRGRSGRKAAA